MALQWGDRPLGAKPTRAFSVREAIAILAVLAVACWAGAHRTQAHLDRGCVHGIQTSCALDGRR